MAALSPDIQPEDVLPALARNVVTNGYQASHANDELEETEFLKLVREEGSAALVATHNERIAAKMDRVLRLHEGHLDPSLAVA